MRSVTLRRRGTSGAVLGAVAGTVMAVRSLYRWLVGGALTLDTGIGRRTVELGPLNVDIDAPREVVFDVIAAPYLGGAGDSGDHIDVLERGQDLVVAAHHTPLTGGRVATTVEAVGFDRPRAVTFRLLRGPVAQVRETFVLEDAGERTRFRYSGELGTDFWAAGALWGAVVKRKWERTVADSVQDVRRRSEERAAAQRRRAKRTPDQRS
jgi:hypothetical protein